ncbi:MAG: hypothetical protein K0Q89_13 [Thermomicrobiales bacterium]|nr:hypothetical protein [Thermomicrobiales bacterium]
MSEIDEERNALGEMIAWVNERASDPEIALVLQALGERGLSLEQLAEQNREEAWQLCDAIFNMVEEDEAFDERLHGYLKRNQPPRRLDPRMRLDGL